MSMEITPFYIMASVGLTITISSLAGINFAMIAFKIKRMKIKSNSSAMLGGAFAAFTPGCPACTAPLAVILGAVGGLSLFPRIKIHFNWSVGFFYLVDCKGTTK